MLVPIIWFNFEIMIQNEWIRHSTCSGKNISEIVDSTIFTCMMFSKLFKVLVICCRDIHILRQPIEGRGGGWVG